MKYKLIFDDGKPQTIESDNLKEILRKLQDLYMENVEADWPFDFWLFEGDKDISDRKDIKEFIGGF